MPGTVLGVAATVMKKTRLHLYRAYTLVEKMKQINRCPMLPFISATVSCTQQVLNKCLLVVWF